MSKQTRQIMIRDTRVMIALLGILSAMGLGVIMYLARDIILPFALAIFISYIMNPIITFFEKRRVPSVFSIILAVMFTIGIFSLLVILINQSINSFASEFPRYEARLSLLSNQAIALFKLPPELFSENIDGSDRLQILTELENFSLSGVITATLRSLTSFLSRAFLVSLFLVFILMGRNQFGRKLMIAFKPAQAEQLSRIFNNINQQIQKYIVTKTLISFLTALLATVVLFAFGVEFALIWGILTFLLNFIPNIGSGLATILPLSVAILQFESVGIIAWIAICLTSIQLVMGNIIDPRVVGRSINLSPLVILFSLIFWGWLWGIVGMFLATPLSVIVKIILENIDDVRFVSILMSAHPEGADDE